MDLESIKENAKNSYKWLAGNVEKVSLATATVINPQITALTLTASAATQAIATPATRYIASKTDPWLVVNENNKSYGVHEHVPEDFLLNNFNNRAHAIAEEFSNTVYLTKNETGQKSNQVIDTNEKLGPGETPSSQSLVITEIKKPKCSTEEFIKIGSSSEFIKNPSEKDQKNNSGLGAITYLSKDKKTEVIAFAGTANGKDVLVDGLQLAGVNTNQYKDAEKYLLNELRKMEKVRSSQKEKGEPLHPSELVITGHSLGGGLAIQAYGSKDVQDVLKRIKQQGPFEMQVTTRDPAGLSVQAYNKVKENLTPETANNIVNHRMKGEFVGLVGMLPGHQVTHGRGIIEAANQKIAQEGEVRKITEKMGDPQKLTKEEMKQFQAQSAMLEAAVHADFGKLVYEIVKAPFERHKNSELTKEGYYTSSAAIAKQRHLQDTTSKQYSVRFDQAENDYNNSLGSVQNKVDNKIVNDLRSIGSPIEINQARLKMGVLQNQSESIKLNNAISSTGSAEKVELKDAVGLNMGALYRFRNNQQHQDQSPEIQKQKLN